MQLLRERYNWQQAARQTMEMQRAAVRRGGGDGDEEDAAQSRSQQLMVRVCGTSHSALRTLHAVHCEAAAATAATAAACQARPRPGAPAASFPCPQLLL
jgi:hypothetical protein